MTATAIETKYRGYRFRSRLEAKWAFFFDHMGIPWHYETQGYLVKGEPYLADFWLTDCGTWVEVKGAEEDLDHGLMFAAAEKLPERRALLDRGPSLLILGPIPEAPERGDLGWIGITAERVWQGTVQDGGRSFACRIVRGDWQCECGRRVQGRDPAGEEELCTHLLTVARREKPETEFYDQWWGFGGYHERKCLQVLRDTSCATPASDDSDGWLTPAADEYAAFDSKVAAAYAAARSARFEHGETPAAPRKRRAPDPGKRARSQPKPSPRRPGGQDSLFDGPDAS